MQIILNKNAAHILKFKGFDNGLKSVITTALTMSILGYPFILPDMIGGNAYVLKENSTDIDFELIGYPDKQLFIRWAQVTAFLPSMQYRYVFKI